jgi:hypothetical protein
VTIRLRAVVVYSWLALGALLAAFGATVAIAPTSSTEMFVGVACISFAVLVAATTLRVSATVRDDELVVRNRLRTFRVDVADLAEVASRVVQTPMTRAMGWGQIELRDGEGRRVRVVASTGLTRPLLHRFLAELQSRAPAATVTVDERVFPTVGS